MPLVKFDLKTSRFWYSNKTIRLGVLIERVDRELGVARLVLVRFRVEPIR